MPPGEPTPCEEIEVAAFVDEVGPEFAPGAQEFQCGGNVVGQLGKLAEKAGQQAAQCSDCAAFSAEFRLVVEAWTDDADLVACFAEGADEFFDVHGHSVMRLDAVAVENSQSVLLYAWGKGFWPLFASTAHAVGAMCGRR